MTPYIIPLGLGHPPLGALGYVQGGAELAGLMNPPRPFASEDILTWDGVLAPGYGRTGPAARNALRRMAAAEGILLDPVFSPKTFAGLLGLLKAGTIREGQKVLLLHTGGLPALFACQNELGFGGAGAP